MRPAVRRGVLRLVPGLALGVGLVLSTVGQGAEGPGPSPHGSEEGCAACHAPGHASTQESDGDGSAPDDISARCLACHPTADMHPIGMEPARAKVGQAFPLDDQGRVTCATCHAETAHAHVEAYDGPDSDALAELPAPWFRGGPHESTTAFCRACHPAGALARISPHTAAKGQARDGSCSACHTGVPLPGAAPDQARLRLEPAATCQTCHPGMPHHGAATHLARPVPQGTELLLDGQDRIACFTCHDVHRHRSSGRVDSKLGDQLHAAARAHDWAGLSPDVTFPGTESDGAKLRLPLRDDALCRACHAPDRHDRSQEAPP